MEVLVQDIKQEHSSEDRDRKDSSQRILISPSNHHHSGGTTTSTKFSNNNHQNNNNLSILENTLTSSSNHNTSTSTNPSVRHPTTANATAAVTATPAGAAPATTATAPAPSSHVTTIKQTKLNGQQLETMAKSSGLSIVHVSLPQTVIQTPSVIQSASGHLQLSKGNVILVSSKPNSSVIQTTSGAIQTQAVQVLQEHHHSEDSLSNDGVEHPSIRDRRRRDILTRRPSYRKILNDLGASEIADKGDSPGTSESSQDPLDDNPGVNSSADANSATALQTITMTNAGTAGGTIVQYAQSHDGQQFFVPVGGELQAYTIRPVSSSASSSPSVVVSGQGGHHPPETRKREIRLLKNREAARECRRKKKEYIKCLENRVAVLENQNKALIDELKSLKELYCQQKTE